MKRLLFLQHTLMITNTCKHVHEVIIFEIMKNTFYVHG